MLADHRRIVHEVLCLSESAFLKHYRCGRFRIWKGVGMTASELPGPGFNFAAAVGPCPPLDAILAVGRDFFAGCEQGWGVLVEGDAGHPAEAEIRDRGWAIAEDEPAFVMPDLSTALPDGNNLGELTIRPLRTEADRATFQRICTAAFNASSDLADLIMPSLAFAIDPQMWWAIGDWKGEPVSVGGYHRKGTSAVVSCLATLESHRGRGIGAAMTRAVLAKAAADGCANAVLRSGPKSVPLYERLGFRYVCQHRTYTVPG